MGPQLLWVWGVQGCSGWLTSEGWIRKTESRRPEPLSSASQGRYETRPTLGMDSLNMSDHLGMGARLDKWRGFRGKSMQVRLKTASFDFPLLLGDTPEYCKHMHCFISLQVVVTDLTWGGGRVLGYFGLNNKLSAQTWTSKDWIHFFQALLMCTGIGIRDILHDHQMEYKVTFFFLHTTTFPTKT